MIAVITNATIPINICKNQKNRGILLSDTIFNFISELERWEECFEPSANKFEINDNGGYSLHDGIHDCDGVVVIMTELSLQWCMFPLPETVLQLHEQTCHYRVGSSSLEVRHHQRIF